jgi:ubiquinone biosynthesis UbiH/UbiF/VisC/COQ6 family hydroxylase
VPVDTPSAAAARSDECDVLVIGAGLAGSSLAAALRPSGLRTILLDAELPVPLERAGWDSRVYAISPGSSGFLRRCGAWQRVPAERIARVEAMHVFGDRDDAEIVFSAYDCGVAELCYIVESRELQRALAEVNAAPGGPVTAFGRAPSDFALGDDAAAVDLAGGGSIAARLVVGADGPASWVRQAAGIEHAQRSYDQEGVVANFACERGHGSIARQWFLPQSVLALLPLPGNHVSMVWSTPDSHAAQLLAADAVELEREVTLASRNVLGALRLVTPPRSFPLRLLRVAQWVRPRLALVGDAAHVVHPLAGQGLNLGLQDARVLADVLCGRGAQDDCGDYRLLRRYARARREAVAAMQWTTDGLQRLFSARTQGVPWLRNAGLRFTNRIVPLKNRLIEHALA